uniref:Uncharacterized protein n=1 Tax=Rhipicephalus zambeziensis TaxID=60191 RepID=A0A224YCR2_9ACAR
MVIISGALHYGVSHNLIMVLGCKTPDIFSCHGIMLQNSRCSSKKCNQNFFFNAQKCGRPLSRRGSRPFVPVSASTADATVPGRATCVCLNPLPPVDNLITPMCSKQYLCFGHVLAHLQEVND